MEIVRIQWMTETSFGTQYSDKFQTRGPLFEHAFRQTIVGGSRFETKQLQHTKGDFPTRGYWDTTNIPIQVV